MIQAINIKKRYNEREVLKGINIKVKENEIVGLLGPNGAGKTTAFSIIIGLIKSEHGKVFYDNKEITNFPMYKRAKLGISFLPQEYSVFRNLTVQENLLSILEHNIYKSSEIKYYLDYFLDRFGLQHVRKQKAATLSGGEKRRLEIARALSSFPSYIFMDEPFTGIDPITIKEIQMIIRELRDEGIGIIVSDHNIRDTLSVTDKAYIIIEGEIKKKGPPDEIVNDSLIKEKYLGKEFKIKQW